MVACEWLAESFVVPFQFVLLWHRLKMWTTITALQKKFNGQRKTSAASEAGKPCYCWPLFIGGSEMKLRTLAVLSVLILALALYLPAQRSTATGLQWDPVAALFHLTANGVDYLVQNENTKNCGTTVACAGTLVPSPITVYGSAPFSTGSPSTITLTGLPFTSTTSYVCVVANATSATHTAVDVVNQSASSTLITGPNTITDTMNYVCVGT